jgi:stage III sporulation protein SpoIIIAA
MNLRQAAEMALKYFEDAHGLEDTEVAIKEALRQALAEEALDRMVAENQRLGFV